MLLKLFSLILIVSLAACGGGGGGSSSSAPTSPSGGGSTPPPVVSTSIFGVGVKGPLANADVALYVLDLSSEDLKGEQIATATTDATGQIQGLSIEDATPPYLLEFSAVEGTTTDLTTGVSLLVKNLITLVDQARLDSEAPAYATPLTTFVLQLAKDRASESTDQETFLATVDDVQAEVKASVAFGLDDDVDLFSTPPIIDETTTSLESQQNVIAHRKAIEAFAAVVNLVAESSGASADSVLSSLASDLADGEIDAVSADTALAYGSSELVALLADPNDLVIPNDPDGRKVQDIQSLVIDERSSTGKESIDATELSDTDDTSLLATIDLQPDIDGDGVFNSEDDDDDGDGVGDSEDQFPRDGTETADYDLDGVGDNADTDDDNDGVSDSSDVFPRDPSESADSDGDGIGNEADTDDDNDGIADVDDKFPVDGGESADADGDGIGDGIDPDDDNDGVADEIDEFPLDASESADTDEDGIGNNADTDDDDDGVADAEDMFPLDAEESLDSDGDGIGNNADDDDDGDGSPDAVDYAPLDPNVTVAPGGGGGGGGGGSAPPATPIDLSGGGIKGPLVGADVFLYEIDANQTGFKGSLVDTAVTNSQAQIVGLAVPSPANPPYLLEFISNAGTTDLTTGVFPVITEMKTVVTQALLDNAEKLYATPLTSMAVDLAFQNADSNTEPYGGNGDGFASDAEIEAALSAAADQVKATMGFGIGQDVDIYDTPPLIDDSRESQEEQSDSAAYRSAVEAMTAVVFQMQQLGGDGAATADEIIGDLAADLSDGQIDGAVDGQETASYPDESLQLLEQDPSTLPIPNEPGNKTVGEVKDLVIQETAAIGSGSDTSAFQADTQIIELKPAETNPDIDGDGVPNGSDAFPEDPSADADNDEDGIPDKVFVVAAGVRTQTVDDVASDDDDDNDGVLDINDAFPTNPDEFLDTDNDGIGNNEDENDDGDNANDIVDDFPLDATRFNATDQDNDGWSTSQDLDDNNGLIPEVPFTDTDGDGLADSGGADNDDDDDGDGVLDVDDAFPLDATESRDLDSDGIGNNTDPDIDGDLVNNDVDRFPFDPEESIDTDRDGIGNKADKDDDGDTLEDALEEVLGTDPLLRDTDSDGAMDNVDNFPLNASERFDTDGDGVGNNSDNCKLVANPAPQLDLDSDGFGDQCDKDDDGDGVPDDVDPFPLDGTETVDTDGDGVGNTADTDDDGDGVDDGDDAFPLDKAEFLDTDTDGIGNNADDDDDGDGFDDVDDDFPLDPTSNSKLDVDNDGWPAGQDIDDGDNTKPGGTFVDTDGDGIGDGTDPDIDGDGVLNGNDAFPTRADESSNLDGDSLGDNEDDDIDGDGHLNINDRFPRDSAEFKDSDNDGIGDVGDNDDDNDGVLDNVDALPFNPLESADLDGNGIGDNSDPDIDGDGVLNEEDAFPRDNTRSKDADGDGFADSVDNCPDVVGPQLDTDNDGLGNVCDDNDDADSELDVNDDLPLDPLETVDTDGDGVGNNADSDGDNDGVPDISDDFPLDPTQSGDADGDGVGDGLDNCLNDVNAGQEDIDGDGMGDACDTKYTPVAENMPASIQIIPDVEPTVSTINVLRTEGNGGVYFFNLPNTGRVADSVGSLPYTWRFNGDGDLEINYLSESRTLKVSAEDEVRQLVNSGTVTQAAGQAFLDAASSTVIDITVKPIQEVFSLTDPVGGVGRLDVVATVEKTFPPELLAVPVQQVLPQQSRGWIDRSKSVYEDFAEVELTSSKWGAYVPVSVDGTFTLVADILAFTAGGSGSSENSGLSFSWSIDARKFLNVTYDNGVQHNFRKYERNGSVVGISNLYAPPAGGLFSDYLRAMPVDTTVVDFSFMEDTFLQNSFSLLDPDAYDPADDIKIERLFGFQLDADGASKRAFGSCDDLDCNVPFLRSQRYFETIQGNLLTWESHFEPKKFVLDSDCSLSGADCTVWRTREWTVLQKTGNRIYVLESDEFDLGAGPQPVFPTRINFYEPYVKTDLDGDLVDTPADLFPLDTIDSEDTDGDGVGDNTDAFPSDSSEQTDRDKDGIGDNKDPDIDGDGILNDLEELAGLNPFNAADATADDDGDGFSNLEEVNSGSDRGDDTSIPHAGTLDLMTASTFNVEGGGPIEVFVQRLFGAAGTVSVDYVMTPTSLTAGVDYTGTVSGTLTWGPGDISPKSFSVVPVDDGDVEGSEYGRVILSNPTNGARLGYFDASFAITDDEVVVNDGKPNPGSISLMRLGQQFGEKAGFVAVDVVRTRGTTGAVSADIVLGGPNDNATQGDDYGTPLTPTVSWADGENDRKRVFIPLVVDLVGEGHEFLTVTLTNLTNDALPGLTSTSISIVDEHVVHDAGMVGYAHRWYAGEEGQGELKLILTRDYGSVGEVSLDISTGTSSAIGGVDFVHKSEPVVWADGDDQPKTVTVPYIADDLDEGVEIFFGFTGAFVSTTGGQAPLLGSGFTIGLIADDTDFDLSRDTDGDGVVDLSDLDDDDDGHRDVFDAFPLDDTEHLDSDGDGVGNNRDAFPNDVTETLDTDGDGTGNNADDDIDGDGQLNDVDDDDDGDGIDDVDEIDHGLDPKDPGDALADNDGDTFTNADEIEDESDPNDPNDLPRTGTLGFMAASHFKAEGEGDIEVFVQRIAGQAQSVSVDYAFTPINPNLIAGVDFVGPVSGTLTWGPNDTAPKSFVVTPIDDGDLETGESGRLTLSNPTNHARLGYFEAILAIIDDEIVVNDGKPDHGSITLMRVGQRVEEVAGFVEVDVVRTRSSLGAVSAELTLGSSIDSAVQGSDYDLPVSGLVSWADGEKGIKTVQIPITYDNNFEGPEFFTVTLTNFTNDALPGLTSTQVSVIDTASLIDQGQIGFAHRWGVVTEQEGFAKVILVRMYGDEDAVEVNAFTWDSSAVAGSDYTSVNETVTWADGDAQPKTVMVPILQDTEGEGAEFLLGLRGEPVSSVGGPNPLGGEGLHILVLTDEEDIDLTLDSDGDGVVDASDLDDDNDGHRDAVDAFPLDPNEHLDSDGDGVGDGTDAFPNDESEQADSDGDGTGDNADAFPNDDTETTDSDGDGVGDNSDADPNDPNVS